MVRNFPRLRASTTSSCIANFGAVVQRPAVHSVDPALDHERLSQGHGAKVFHLHAAGESDLAFQLVGLAHGLIENGGDDASVGVAGRPDKAGVEFEFADIALAAGAESEAQMQPIGIGRTAAKTEIARPTRRGYIVIMVVLAVHDGLLRETGLDDCFDSAWNGFDSAGPRSNYKRFPWQN